MNAPFLAERADTGEGRIHSYGPIYDASSVILILGTMASPASLRAGMYYGHKQNAFWRLLGDLSAERCGSGGISDLPVGATNEEKRLFLLRQGIALWDTVESCEREGAADSAIRLVQPNDIPSLVARCPRLRAVFLNGSAAMGFYEKYHAHAINLPYYRLPSTSPANASGGYEAKLCAWRAALMPYLAAQPPRV